MLASRRYGTLYVGVTSKLGERVWQHREGVAPGFTRKHAVKLLVYNEFHDSIVEAIRREKQIKEWRRAWKIDLIQRMNPTWRDLCDDLIL